MPDIDEVLKRINHVHFIGIGGSGMCPLAEILFAKGYKISGSDNNETDTLQRGERLCSNPQESHRTHHRPQL